LIFYSIISTFILRLSIDYPSIIFLMTSSTIFPFRPDYYLQFQERTVIYIKNNFKMYILQEPANILKAS